LCGVYEPSDTLDVDTFESGKMLSLSTNQGARAVESRIRTGRLPLPRRVMTLTPSDEPTLDGVNAFVDRLAALALVAWLEIGESVVAGTPPPIEERSAAWSVLTKAITDHALGVAAWYARDAVETSAFLAKACRRRWTSRDRWLFAAAHGVAEESALAVLARPHVDGASFAILIAPFRALLP
jgi:hypothetical protein